MKKWEKFFSQAFFAEAKKALRAVCLLGQRKVKASETKWLERRKGGGAYIERGSMGAAGGTKVILYNVSVGRFETPLAENERFTTNRQISEKISEICSAWKWKVKKVDIGHISYVIETNAKIIRMGCYYPVVQLDLRGMRLSPRIVLNCTKDLQKRFPDYRIIPRAFGPNKRRKRQPSKLVSMQQEIQRIGRYVGGFAKRRQAMRKRRRM